MSKYLQAAKNLLENIGEDLATVFGFLKKHETEIATAVSEAPAAAKVIGSAMDAAGGAISIVIPPVGAGVRAAASAIETVAGAAPTVVATAEKMVDAFGNVVDHLEGKVTPASPPAATTPPTPEPAK